MITETVYLGKSNTNDLLLKADGSAVSLASVTRMTLEIGGTTVDSATDEVAFDWTTGTTGKVILSLGHLNSVVPGSYMCTLTVYDPQNTSGIVWTEELMLVFK